MTNDVIMRGPRITPVVGIFVFLVAFFLICGRSKLLNEADTFWHIAVGRTILSTGRFVRQDTFSCTRFHQPWIANQWLAECAMALVDEVAGFDGLLVVTASLLAALFSWGASRFLRGGLHWLPACLIVTLAITASASNLHARPTTATAVLFGLVFAMLLELDLGRVSHRRAFWLVPCFVVWANLHGGVLGGIGTLLLAAAGWAVAPWLKLNSPVASRREGWLLAGVCSLSVLALLATPYGAGSLAAWLKIMRMPLQQLVVEHRPLNIASVDGVIITGLVGGYVLLLISIPRHKRRVTFLLPIIWFMLTLSRVRHAPLFAVSTLLAAAELLPISPFWSWLDRRGWILADPSRRKSRLWPAFAVCLSLSLGLLLAASVRQQQLARAAESLWASPDPHVYPAELEPALRQFADRHAGSPLFNEPHLGGFLIYRFPRLRVFVDSRFELYGEAFLQTFLAAEGDPRMLRDWQDEYGLQAALIERNSPFEAYFCESNGWQQVAESPTASFYTLARPAANRTAEVTSGDR